MSNKEDPARIRAMNEVRRAIQDDIDRLRALSANAYRSLASAFSEMRSDVDAVHRTIVETTERFVGRDQLTDIPQRAVQSLNRFAETIVKTGKSSMEIAYGIDDVAARIREINEAVAAIERITLQTNTLAFNASLEAVRAREGGRGFAVVASEVRALARETATMSARIENIATGLTALLEQMRSAVEGLASHDLNYSLMAQEQSAEVIARMTEMSTSLRDALDATRQRMERHSATVTAGIIGLQFDDLIQQTLNQIEQRLEQMDALSAGKPVESTDGVRTIVTQRALVGGSVELF